MIGKVIVGKFVNTHGIKGEIRLISDFELKEKIFKSGIKIYMREKEFVITGHRVHKNYDMLTLKDISDINQILEFKGSLVYANRSDLEVSKEDYLLNDLLGFSVCENNVVLGKVNEVVYNKANVLLSVEGAKKFYIPYHEEFIISVDLEEKKVHVRNASDLII